MGQNYKQLSLDERCTIAILQREGQSIQKIAAAMARSASTISREIKRNTGTTIGYRPSYAQQQTAGRRWRGSRLERQSFLRTTVLDLLAMGWSPQIVSKRLAQESACNSISYESIYRFIYSQIRRTNDYSWRHYLPRRKSKRGFRGRKGGSPVDFIKQRISIHQRPAHVLKRTQTGHWEADLMLFSKYGQAILVVQERASRMLMLFKLNNKKSETILIQLHNLFDCLPKAVTQSITFDNGTEFAEHYRLNALGVKTYFCDVKSPWQKGGIENAIGRLRRSLPRKTDLDTMKAQSIETIVALYNHTPRKCLGYKTPAEVFSKKLLHFKCELTFQPALE
jgi:IS30 family transposase